MYSDNTLHHMTKSELIELLKIAQHNYEAVLESYGNAVAHSEKLLKERDNGIREFADKLIKLIKQLYCTPQCHFNLLTVQENINRLMEEMVGEDDGRIH